MSLEELGYDQFKHGTAVRIVKNTSVPPLSPPPPSQPARVSKERS